jgi:ubiquinone biosynthesis protein
MGDVLETSRWAAERQGLPEAAAYWFTKAPPHRAYLGRRALRLATPSLSRKTLGAVGSTAGRVLRAVGPNALADILGDASRSRSSRAVDSAQQLVKAGGPAYVKLGQFIASARGILPDEWVDAFGWCRDEVPPLERGTAEQMVERSFGQPPSRLFAAFDPDPIGAASIAQVHTATLHDGTDVVVKVRRPGLRRRFEADIRVMSLLAGVAERTVTEARMANLSGFVELFAHIVLEELDFRLEAVNIVELALASEHAAHDYVGYPRPVPDLVTQHVLVMERMPGVRYTDALEAYPGRVDGRKLLRLAIQGVLEQTLIYGMFHGDLHAGNVLIGPDGGFSLVDFGIVGRLDAEQRASLVRFMLGFGQGDVRAQLEAMREFGAIPEGADFDKLVAELERHAEAAMELEFRAGGLDAVADALGSIIRALASAGFIAPKELVLFFKNMLYLNGFAAAIAPDVNLIEEIEPVFMYFTAKYGEAMTALTREQG